MNPKTFKTIIGSKPILLSAPHVYAHRRPKLSMAYKIGEPLTDIIVEGVCKEIKSFGIVLTDESDMDYNYHKEKSNPYKKEIRNLVEKENIKYFVDIHGLKDGNNYDIAIYYPSKFFKSIQLSRKVKEGLSKGALRGSSIPVFRLPEDHQESLTLFTASELRIPSIQIEVARYIREKKELRDAFIQNLSEVLEDLVI
jgi:hypothetical protein